MFGYVAIAVPQTAARLKLVCLFCVQNCQTSDEVLKNRANVHIMIVLCSVFQCHGLQIESQLLPKSLTSEVRIVSGKTPKSKNHDCIVLNLRNESASPNARQRVWLLGEQCHAQGTCQGVKNLEMFWSACNPPLPRHEPAIVAHAAFTLNQRTLVPWQPLKKPRRRIRVWVRLGTFAFGLIEQPSSHCRQ